MEKKKETKKVKKESKEDILKIEIEKLKEENLRVRADFDNFRKRKEKESLEIRERAVEEFVLDLLPIIDNFEMSLNSSSDVKMFKVGVEMIHKNLLRILEEHNFIQFEGNVKDDFNPKIHEPVLLENHKGKEGKIVSVLSKGYKRKERVIRPVKVGIIKKK